MKNKPYCDIDFSEEAIEFYKKDNRLRYLYASKIIKKLKNKTIVADIGMFWWRFVSIFKRSWMRNH